MELEIKRIQNGYLLTSYNEETGEELIAIEALPDENDNEVMRRLLMEIAEYFGCHYDKWSEHNLNITLDNKGHKVE